MKFVRDREFDAVEEVDDGLLETDGFHVGRRERARGVWLTLLLCLLIVGYSFAVWVNLVVMLIPHKLAYFKSENPNTPDWFLPAVTICVALNVVWIVSLLRWKKWGYYAFALTCVAMFGLHVVAGRDYLNSILSMAAAVVLLLLLRWGGARSAWSFLT